MTRRAFTLIELLVAMGIIVLMVAMAVPLFGVFTGNRSVEGAENQVSALLSTARTEAMALQQYRGVMFYLPQGADRISAQVVYAREEVGGYVELDAVADRDPLRLPMGISVQALNESGQSSLIDMYLGFNPIEDSNIRIGGVLLFDPRGHLAALEYGFRVMTPAAAVQPTPMGRLLYPPNGPGTGDKVQKFALSGTATLRSQPGLALFRSEGFSAAGFTLGDPQIEGGGTETAEEKWLNDNSIPLLINRYNGTLIRGE